MTVSLKCYFLPSCSNMFSLQLEMNQSIKESAVCLPSLSLSRLMGTLRTSATTDLTPLTWRLWEQSGLQSCTLSSLTPWKLFAVLQEHLVGSPSLYNCSGGRRFHSSFMPFACSLLEKFCEISAFGREKKRAFNFTSGQSEVWEKLIPHKDLFRISRKVIQRTGFYKRWGDREVKALLIGSAGIHRGETSGGGMSKCFCS